MFARLLFFFTLAAPLAAQDLVTLSNALSPRVAYRLAREGEGVRLTVEAAGFEPAAKGVSLEAGLAADRTIRLVGPEARATPHGSAARWEFTFPAGQLVDSPAGWRKLRVGLAVTWAGGPFGAPRLRQRFLHLGAGSGHRGLAADSAEWQPVDLDELSREEKDRAREIHFTLSQPMDGKATIVIDNARGERVRNLLSGQSMPAGAQRVVWDGLDESGQVAPPGEYRWRAISHPGLAPVHLMDFCGAPGSNHGTMQAAATNGHSVFFGAPVSEGGWELIELSPDGKFIRGYNPPGGHGLQRVALAADERYLYAAHDGTIWGQRVDRSAENWKEERLLSLVRFDLQTGESVDFPGKVRHAPLRKYEMGPGSRATMTPAEFALAGLALVGGKLYLADHEAGEVMVIDPATGRVERKFPLPKVEVLAPAPASGLLAIVPGKLLRVDLATGAGTPLAALTGKPTGLFADTDGLIYVSDAAEHVVRVMRERGEPVRTIGKPGGIAPGPYDPLRLQNPAGLVAFKGRVWVTERDRWQPKRLAAFDTATGAVVTELFGPTNYGAQGAGFDDRDQSRWIGQDALWQVDLASGESRPTSILGGETGRRHRFYRQDGRTFILTSGKATFIQELRADGTLHPLACFSSAHQFAYAKNWKPPEGFVIAFQKAYPQLAVTIGKRGGIEREKPGQGYGLLWVDRNGDGEMQAEEFEFSTAATNLGGSGWSHDFFDLTLRIPGDVDGRKVLVTLKPEGWWPGGAPKYPPLNDAVRAGVPIALPGSNSVESIVDRAGDLILNSDPAMRAFSPEGKLLWTFPNRWVGVHGSHNSPLPTPGEMQGALFFSGLAPLDSTTDVFLLNGNHGRAFLLTSDGLYLDEMFPDVRLMNNPQAGGVGILGGECFGGTFGKSEKDGNYYFQGGGIAYRIYRVDGLRETKRSEGSLTVSAEQVAAAERLLAQAVATKARPASASIPACEKPPVIDGRDKDWSSPPVAQWEKGGKFSVTVRAARDREMLYLLYQVSDASPWVNEGKDWQQLFKTGDGVDLQLGVDSAANPKRSGPVPGDLRLFLAPMGKTNVAVLYRHRLPGAPPGEAAVFQSPWRSEKIDSVRRLDNVRMAVQREANGYRLEAAVPLAELGLSGVGAATLRGDFGVIYGDAEGTTNIFRNYWSNQATGLVNDVPGEIMLTPQLWGDLLLAAPSPASK